MCSRKPFLHRFYDDFYDEIRIKICSVLMNRRANGTTFPPRKIQCVEFILFTTQTAQTRSRHTMAESNFVRQYKTITILSVRPCRRSIYSLSGNLAPRVFLQGTSVRRTYLYVGRSFRWCVEINTILGARNSMDIPKYFSIFTILKPLFPSVNDS